MGLFFTSINAIDRKASMTTRGLSIRGPDIKHLKKLEITALSWKILQGPKVDCCQAKKKIICPSISPKARELSQLIGINVRSRIFFGVV
jgi:hypothetical protein